MRKLSLFLLCLLLCVSVWAKDSSSQSRTRLKSFLDTMASYESQAKTIQPMMIAAAKRTPAENVEINRRIEFLDSLLNSKVKPLGREISDYQAQLEDSQSAAYAGVKEAHRTLTAWLDAKLSLQNAGINNPSLDVLRKNEPQRYQEYQARMKAAREGLK